MDASPQQIGRSLIDAASDTFGTDRPSGHIYTDDEKHAALGRHSVYKTDLSTEYLAGMGVLGGLAGAAVGGIARAVGDYSLRAVALAGAAGATLGVLGAAASAKPMTPLEHAKYQLDLAKADEAILLGEQRDKPDYQCTSSDVAVIDHMAHRYQESWRSFYLLYFAVHTPAWNDNHELISEFYVKLHFELGIGRNDINYVVTKMSEVTSIDAAEELPEFKQMAARLQIPAEYKEDLAKMMFILNCIVHKDAPNPVVKRPSIEELYQDLFKSKLSMYKARLEQDKIRLEEDIRILSAIKRQQPACDSTLPATGTEC